MPTRRESIRAAVLLTAAFTLASVSSPVKAQNRGVYPLGMTATNSGTVADAGITYVNAFLFYSRNKSLGPSGELLATGSNSVLMDMNTFAWVCPSRLELLGQAKFSIAATIPIANNSLTSDLVGSVSGGGGLADSFYQPFILGWSLPQADIRFAYGFLAPTGRFQAGASDNVGSGYWTHTLSLGETFFLTPDRATAISAFEIYEFHGQQESTRIHPGQTMSLDYSVTRSLRLGQDLRLQIGLAGYEQRQTTDKSGPNVTPAEAGTRYQVNSLGVAANLALPDRRMSLGAKFFREFSNRSTFQGYSVQITGGITF